jgi:hypothetical protein
MRTGSYPHAKFVGQREKEYSWFAFSSRTPGLAHSVSYAARKIFRAAVQGRSEVEVGMDAYLAAPRPRTRTFVNPGARELRGRVDSAGLRWNNRSCERRRAREFVKIVFAVRPTGTPQRSRTAPVRWAY